MNATFVDETAAIGDDEDDLDAEDGISDAPLVRLVNSMIFQAAEDGASDIHVEPQEDELVSATGSTACSMSLTGFRSGLRPV